MSKENKNDLLNILRIQEIELQEQDQQLTKLGKTLINAVNLYIERKNRIAELEKELKEEQEKHCDTCYCDLQRENEKLKAELESKKQMLAGKRFEMFDNDIKQTSTLNGVEFTYEQMLVIKQYEGFCDNKEKQTAVKEFADKIKDINFVDYCEIRNYDQIKYVWFNYVSFNVKINKLLKEKGIE